MNEAEIVIIGGGIAGVSAAYHLSELGHRVLLLERDAIAAHASGLNSSLISSTPQRGVPDLEALLTAGSLEIYRSLQLDQHADIEFRQSGTLRAICSEAEAELASQVVEAAADATSVRLLSVGEARSIEPELSPNLLGALLFPRNAQANPVKATRALAQAAERQGARIVTRCAVTDVARRADGSYLIRAGDMTVSAVRLVIAAGPWAPAIGALLGIEIPVVTVRGQMWATEALPPRLQHNLSSMESSLYWHQASAEPELPSHLTHRAGRRVTRHLYGRQTRAGEIIFGGDRELLGDHAVVDPDGIASNHRHASELLPLLAALPVQRSWAGLMAFSRDGHPLVGPVPGEPALWLIGGMASSGFGEAPMAGRLLATWMHAGRRPDLLVAADPAGRVHVPGKP
jgi:sarcosine oxidase subunit beta